MLQKFLPEEIKGEAVYAVRIDAHPLVPEKLEGGDRRTGRLEKGHNVPPISEWLRLPAHLGHFERAGLYPLADEVRPLRDVFVRAPSTPLQLLPPGVLYHFPVLVRDGVAVVLVSLKNLDIIFATGLKKFRSV